jgi:hypothetical protein
MTAGWTKKNSKWVWKQTPKKDKASQKKYAAYRANPTTYKVYYSNYYKAKAAAQLKQAQARAKAQAIARAKAAEAERRKKDGIFGWVKKGISAARGFMQEHSKFLGGVGVVLGVASMITPLGWMATAALVAGFALGAATTADACFSRQWGSCVLGAASLGMAGIGVGAGRMAASLKREAVDAPIFTRMSMKLGAFVSRGLAGVGNVSSVGYGVTGTATGGNLGSEDWEDE